MKDNGSKPEVIDISDTSQTRTRRATGPRTLEGKRRSKYNAVNHGIFARVVLEGRESKQEYRRLLQALQEDLQPEGTLEEILVEQLAMLYWRRRRVLEAENGEIQRAVKFHLLDKLMEQVAEVKATDDRLAPWAGGLLRREQNPYILYRCIELLKDWRKGFAESGFDSKQDIRLLARESLPLVYRVFFAMAQPEAEAEVGACLTPTQAKEAMLKFIDEEIERLAKIQQDLEEQQLERLTHEAEAQLIPPNADRLMRYEMMLSREIEKTLNHLERLQRRRRGERDLPPIKLDLSM